MRTAFKTCILLVFRTWAKLSFVVGHLRFYVTRRLRVSGQTPSQPTSIPHESEILLHGIEQSLTPKQQPPDTIEEPKVSPPAEQAAVNVEKEILQARGQLLEIPTPQGDAKAVIAGEVLEAPILPVVVPISTDSEVLVSEPSSADNIIELLRETPDLVLLEQTELPGLTPIFITDKTLGQSCDQQDGGSAPLQGAEMIERKEESIVVAVINPPDEIDCTRVDIAPVEETEQATETTCIDGDERTEDVPAHVKIFLASRLLAERCNSFTRDELVKEVEVCFNSASKRVIQLVHSSALEANHRPITGVRYNYLYAECGNLIHCFHPSIDVADHNRAHFQNRPKLDLVPKPYRHLWDKETPVPPRSELPITVPVGMGAPNAQTLNGWERYLAVRLDGVKKVFQADISVDETKILGELIRQIGFSRGTNKTFDEMVQNYPHVLVAYMVFMGVYGYLDGNYWQAVTRDIGWLRLLVRHDWARSVVKLCEEWDLGDHREGEDWIDYILMQGGIPQACMPRFLDTLTNCFRRPGGSANLPRELIRELCQLNTAGLPKPVLRFLQRGNELAVKIVHACLQELGYESLGGQDDTGILPRFMIEAVNKWKQENIIQPVAKMRLFSLQSPYITYDPWRAQICVSFPEQQIENETRVFWQIREGKESERVDCQQRHIGDFLDVDVVQRILKPTVSTHITVSLYAGLKHLLKEWLLDIHGGKGVYFFEPNTRKLNTELSLSPKRCWLVRSPETKLSIEPKGLLPIREKFAEPEGWRSWEAYEIDLEGCTALIIENKQEVYRLDVRLNNESTEPRLVGGVRLSGCASDTPVYIGYPPSIEFPMVMTNQDSDWLIQIKPRPGAQPDYQSSERRLQTIKGAFELKDDRCILDLAHDNLLGTSPCGMYEIVCRAEGGKPSSFVLRITPIVTLKTPESVLMPDTNGSAPTAVYEYSIPDNQVLSILKPDHRVSVHELKMSNGIRTYRFETAPDMLEVPIGIFTDSRSVTPIVEWVLAIPRFRWQLRSEAVGKEQWHVERQTLSLDELGNLVNPFLVVDVPKLNPNNPVTLLLLDQTNEVMLEVFSQSSGDAENLVVFPFNNISTFVREHYDLTLRATLQFTLIQHSSSRQIDILNLSLHPALDKLSVERNNPQDSAIFVQWRPNPMIPSRQIRLWNCARPWDSCVSLDIEDGLVGKCNIDISPGIFPDGFYWAELRRNDAWINSVLERQPVRNAPYLKQLCIGIPEQRLSGICELLRQGQDIFSLGAEAALLAFLLNDQTKGKSLQTWCSEHTAESDLDHLTDATISLAYFDDVTLLRRDLFREIRIKEAAAKYESGVWEVDRLSLYLEQCPDLSCLAVDELQALSLMPNPVLSWDAIGQLIKLGEPSGYEAAFTEFNAANKSYEDVLVLLDHNPKRSVEVLEGMPETDETRKLMDGLYRRHPDFIHILRKGYWVHCRAGWGKIRSIFDGCQKERAMFDLNLPKNGIHMVIDVRPGFGKLEAIIDLYSCEVILKSYLALWACINCDEFVGIDHDVYYEHNRVAHEGISSGNRPANDLRQKTVFAIGVDAPKGKEFWR